MDSPFEEILIPREVHNEVVVNGLLVGAPEAGSIQFLVQQGHIQVREVSLPSPLPAWSQSIDLGEAEVIALAQAEPPDWVLIDNAHARTAARQLGFSPKGTVGLLLDAFRKGHLSLDEFELLIHNIKAQPSLWISESLCDRALIQARTDNSPSE